jgi:adenylate cyclase
VFEGKIEEATKLFERAAVAKPTDYQCLCLLVQWYHSLGSEEDSKEAARKGAKLAERQPILHPDDARAAELGAGALMKLGETNCAREWVARALAIEPNNPPTQYNAACIYAQLGDVEKAFKLLEDGLVNGGPEWGRWIQYDSDLESLRNDPRYRRLLEEARRQDVEKG